MHISKKDERVAAAAETLVSAGGTLTKFRYIVESGLVAHGVPSDAAAREALGCIRTALERSIKD